MFAYVLEDICRNHGKYEKMNPTPPQTILLKKRARVLKL